MSNRHHHPKPTTDVVVVTGAAPLAPDAVAQLPTPAVVIAADGGLDHALAAGLTPDVLVGDLDSVSPEAVAWARAHSAVVEHPTDKAATDTELSLAAAVARGPQRLVMIAGVGDRIDHTVAAIGALGAPATEAIHRVEGWWGRQHLLIARPGRPVDVEAPPGTTFSVVALHGRASGVSIHGARWPLTDATVEAVSGLGVSNEVAASPVTITVAHGVLTVIVQPPVPPLAPPSEPPRSNL